MFHVKRLTCDPFYAILLTSDTEKGDAMTWKEKLQNPDTIAEAIVEIDEMITRYETEKSDTNARLADLEKSNATLRDTNARLALKITGDTTPEEPEPEKTPEEEDAEFLAALIGDDDDADD